MPYGTESDYKIAILMQQNIHVGSSSSYLPSLELVQRVSSGVLADITGTLVTHTSTTTPEHNNSHFTIKL